MVDLLEGLHPGYLEAVTGPMGSGKTLAVIFRINKLRYNFHIPYLVFKPKIDDRFEKDKLVSRSGEMCDAIAVDGANPGQIYQMMTEDERDVRFIAIDEAQFFDNSLVEVVHELIKREKNVLVSGLDTDFRGEPFGPIPQLLCKADHVSKLITACAYPDCKKTARWTQRLINGEPAPYNSPLILVGAQQYEARCTEHHYVPR